MVRRVLSLENIARVNSYASGRITRLSLHDLLTQMRRLCSEGRPEAFIGSARWLQQELPVRIAHQLKEYYRLPMMLVCPSFTKVHDSHLRTFELITQLQPINSGRDVLDFSSLLEREVAHQAHTIRLFRSGMGELKEHLSREDLRPLQEFLDTFMVTKIGNRVLVDNFVTWLKRAQTVLNDDDTEWPMSLGIVHESKLTPFLHCAVDRVSRASNEVYGTVPEIVIHGEHDTEMMFIPAHIQFIMQEILKNSVKATLELHNQDGCVPPRVHIAVHPGTYDVEIKVSDQGGGMKRRTVKKVWEYGFSTSHGAGEISGYGVGVPLSRLFARYFGGDMSFSSVYGYGTDVSIRVKRLGDTAELGCSVDSDESSQDEG